MSTQQQESDSSIRHCGFRDAEHVREVAKKLGCRYPRVRQTPAVEKQETQEETTK